MDNMREEKCTENKTGIEFVWGKNLKHVIKTKKGIAFVIKIR